MNLPAIPTAYILQKATIFQISFLLIVLHFILNSMAAVNEERGFNSNRTPRANVVYYCSMQWVTVNEPKKASVTQQYVTCKTLTNNFFF